VSIGTFSWRSIIDLRRNPLTSSVVMLATVGTVVATHDLAIGVLVGVLLSGIFFAGKVAKLFKIIKKSDEKNKTLIYEVHGQVFFASAESFAHAFDYNSPHEKVIIDVTAAHLWDITAVGALDTVVMKYRKAGVEVEVIGFNKASA